MPRERIYIADDEAHIRNIMASFLQKQDFEVTTFSTGDQLLTSYKEQPADLIILDIMMPGSDGYALVSALRSFSHVPIILVSAKDTEQDKIRGLRLGSDDYMTKPFGPMELVARVEALLRRAAHTGVSSPQSSIVTESLHSFGDLSIDDQKLQTLYSNHPLDLSPTEYTFLAYLLRNAHRAVGREELLQEVWGFDTPIKTRATDDTLKRLRKKLSEAGSKVMIETVWGYGFLLKLQPPQEL